MPTVLLMLAAITTAGVQPTFDVDDADTGIVDFDNQVMPILTRAGCNTGACHGAAVGRGGFRLSLYGGNPAADYETIVQELEGRRVNLAHPTASLLVQKATESINHGGGPRLELDGADHRRLVAWITQGAARQDSPQLVRFRVQPPAAVVDRIGKSISLRATAVFSDGVERDVTAWTVFSAEDPAAIEIDSQTVAAVFLRRGRHIVVARYLDRVVPMEFLVPLSERPVDLTNQRRHNFIDDHVLKLLETLRLPVSPQVDDATFLRRLSLDLTGRLPSLKLQQSFLSDHDPNRRSQLIDQLLASDEFTEYWTLRLAELLRIRSQPQDAEGSQAYHVWLRQQLTQATPYDELARQLINASGDSHEVGPANFYRTVGGPREQAEFVSELFMGNRLRCANCHNHPLDRWTQDDYHGLAAIFARVRSGRTITVNAVGEVIHPRTGEPATIRIPGERFLDARSDPREELAAWLTARDNPYFARAIVNRLWKAMLGRGLVEPADDLRATNPPTHPALLDELARDFIAHNYDLRHTLRTIVSSATYSRSARTLDQNQVDQQFYSHALVRPLPPQVLADAISDVLAVPEPYGKLPLGTRAVTLIDPQTPSTTLDVLGRCSREDSCETTGEVSGGLTRMLHMMNGPLLNRRLAEPTGRLPKLLDSKTPTDEIVIEFYQAALGRVPTQAELNYWQQGLEPAAASNAEFAQRDRRQALQDFVWSLLSCREFVTNH